MAMAVLTISHRKALLDIYCDIFETFPSPMGDVPQSKSNGNENFLQIFQRALLGSEWMAWQVDEDLDDLKEVSAVPVQATFTSTFPFCAHQNG